MVGIRGDGGSQETTLVDVLDAAPTENPFRNDAQLKRMEAAARSYIKPIVESNPGDIFGVAERLAHDLLGTHHPENTYRAVPQALYDALGKDFARGKRAWGKPEKDELFLQILNSMPADTHHPSVTQLVEANGVDGPEHASVRMHKTLQAAQEKEVPSWALAQWVGDELAQLHSRRPHPHLPVVLDALHNACSTPEEFPELLQTAIGRAASRLQENGWASGAARELFLREAVAQAPDKLQDGVSQAFLDAYPQLPVAEKHETEHPALYTALMYTREHPGTLKALHVNDDRQFSTAVHVGSEEPMAFDLTLSGAEHPDTLKVAAEDPADVHALTTSPLNKRVGKNSDHDSRLCLADTPEVVRVFTQGGRQQPRIALHIPEETPSNKVFELRNFLQRQGRQEDADDVYYSKLGIRATEDTERRFQELATTSVPKTPTEQREITQKPKQ